MVSYPQLEAEPWWGDEYQSPALTAFNQRMANFFHLDLGSQVGSKGDNNHLYGRHRSYNWSVNSIYCEDPSYGTRDKRDQPGDHDWLRATDTGISGQVHWDAAHRLDQAVRAGRLPGVAEWFGTFDGITVVGWYQGSPSSSDSSHLFHLHVGYWNQYANDAGMFQTLGDIITGVNTGEDMFLANINGSGDVWKCTGAWRAKIAPGNAALFDQLKARFGAPWVVKNADELEYVGGRDVATVEGGGTSGGWLTADQVHEIVRSELNATQLKSTF